MVTQVTDRALLASISVAPSDLRDLYLHSSFTHAPHERRRTYARWFCAEQQYPALRILDPWLRSTLVRFRLGAHELHVVTGARPPRIPRQNRLCSKCSMQIVEDEAHLVFECPLYASVRHQYSDLFCRFSIADTIILSELDLNMRLFFSHDNQYRVAKFIKACLILINSVLI